jgi:hypothetical protein
VPLGVAGSLARGRRVLVAGGLVAALHEVALEQRLVGGGETGGQVHRPDVEPLRHRAGFDLLPAVLEVGLLVVVVVLGPLGEVHVAAALVDVARHQPGARGDARVERPLRLVAVAVEAGAPEDRLHVGRRVELEARGRVRPDVLGGDAEHFLAGRICRTPRADQTGDDKIADSLRRLGRHGSLAYTTNMWAGCAVK